MKDFSYYYNLFEDMLDFYEFDLEVDNEGFWRITDRQYGNLGGIEQEQFNTLTDILDRMDVYHIDYIIRPLSENFPDIEFYNWSELYNEIVEIVKNSADDLSEFEFDIRVLEMILYGAEILSNKKDNDEMKVWWRQNNE